MAQPQRPGGFDMTRVSTGSKILLVAGLLLLIDLFLPWQGVDLGFGFGSANASGFTGIGILVGLLVIAMLAWEGILAAGVTMNLGTMSPGLISAILGGAVALFTLIKFLTSLDFIKFGAFVGLILALVIAYGAWMRYSESRTGALPPPAA